MPFTLSHAAAVLPGIRRSGRGRGPLVASALVAGSFAPDMTYYADTAVPEAMEFGEVTHSVWGVFTVDVLVTGAVVAVWLMLREPLVALLPRAARGRVHTFLRGRPRQPGRPVLTEVVWFVLSAVIGSGTHVVWDAFTHHDRWGTELIPALNGSIGGHPVFQVVQYGSSAVALTVLAWFTYTGLRRVGPVPSPASVPVLTRRERGWARTPSHCASCWEPPTGAHAGTPTSGTSTHPRHHPDGLLRRGCGPGRRPRAVRGVDAAAAADRAPAAGGSAPGHRGARPAGRDAG